MTKQHDSQRGYQRREQPHHRRGEQYRDHRGGSLGRNGRLAGAGNDWMLVDTSAQRFRHRVQLVFIVVAVLVVAFTLRLTWVQLIASPDLSARASEQRTSTVIFPSLRGAINDRNGRTMAYTMSARSLSVHPSRLKEFIAERHRLSPKSTMPPEERIPYIAETLPDFIKDAGQANADIKSDDILEKLNSESTYEVLVRDVDPDVAEKVAQEFPEITSERQDIRQYPNGAVGANFLGKISADNQGQFGLELSQDSKLQGINGSRTVDISPDGYIIPGSTRNEFPAVNGSDFELTVDLDAQTFIQQQVQQAKDKSGAKSASAVVLDAHTGEIVALTSSDSVNPNGDVERQLRDGKVFGDRTTAEIFEPGSVAKIMTAAAAIEENKTSPDEVLTVPGSIDMAGVTVRDAWDHGDVQYTTTGIFGKSSNVGTLMLAQRVGEEKMYDYFRAFGVGQAAGVGLPYEAAGSMPELSQWSGGTFANLPIGQGMSMNLLQMTSVYQTMANGGVRVEPRLISSVKGVDGSVEHAQPAKETRVVSEATARTVVDMFRAVNQSDPTGVNQGTGAGAGVEGYQTSGKTGTAQQIDPDTGAYSNSNYWITYAGIAPADNPRFVVGIMLDDPERGTDGGGGGTAAPLFSDIASWLLDHYNIPRSPDEGPKLMLEVQ